MTIPNEDFEALKKRIGRATLYIDGDEYVMEGPSGRHTLAVSTTDITRLKKHWKSFANVPSNKLPTRKNEGLTLSYNGDSNTLYINSAGYTASLSCAANEGLLSNGLEDRVLSPKQNEIVQEWMELHDDYLIALGGYVNLDYDESGNWVGPVANENGWTP